MSIQLRTYELISFLLFSLNYLQVTRSETKMDTWIKAVLDCNEKNAYLESNTTVLKNYMTNHNDVTNLWVGKFEAFLPWIEIRGCYKIPQICNSKERDEKVAKNSALCQLKCTKRRYFAFNPDNRRCVCFDDHGIVIKNGENASLCQTCTDQTDCNNYAVAYAVLNRSTIAGSNEHTCLSFQCKPAKAMPFFVESNCYDMYCKPYCRNWRRAVVTGDQPFFKNLESCERNHFSYPLLQSENPAELCNASNPEPEGTDIWIGVYRQKLFVDYLNRTVLQDFDMFKQTAKYISQCTYLSMNDALEKTEDCRNEHTKNHYICSSDTSMKLNEDPKNGSTSTPACGTEDPEITDSNNQSSGLIAGIVTAILVIVVVVVIVVLIYRRRVNSKIPKLKDKHGERDPPKSTTSAQEKNSDGQYHEIDITLGPYSFVKPLADTNSRVDKTADDENPYSRIVSAVFDSSNGPNVPKKTNHVISNQGYNDLQIKVDTKTNPNGNQQSSNSLADDMKPADYCLADPGEIDPYTYNADYDHLSNVKNREENTVKVYDHVPNIIDSDGTYDHSTINICKAESNNYDHFDVKN